MTEKQTVNGRAVWIKVAPHPVERANANIIPNEYFTASYFLKDPGQDGSAIGILLKDENGNVSLFESPVAALEYASKRVKDLV